MTEQINVPKLRFGEFEAYWVKQALGERMTIFRGASPRPKGDPRYYGGSVPRLMIQDATRDGKYTTPRIDFLTEEGGERSRYLNAGSVVLSCSGTRVAIPTLLAVDACVHDGWLAFKDYKDIEPEYLYYLFVKLHERMQGSATTGGVFNNLTTEIMNNLLMSFPTLPEQQKIASFLSKVDEKIALLTEKKDKLTEYKKGVMQQLFNGRWEEQQGELTFIPPTLRFKADDGTEFPDWEEKRITEIAHTYIGLVTTMTAHYVERDGVFLIRNSDIKQNKIKTEQLIQLSHNFAKEHKNRALQLNDIVTVHTGDIGVSSVITEDLVGSQGFATLNTRLISDRISAEYLCWYYNSFSNIKFAYSVATGDGRSNYNLKDFNRAMIPIPEMAEQIKIANFLSAIDQKIDLANSELEKAKEWKRGLLQQMFV
ncbi:restriction endonuclease subunit S [Vibrio caribbeanicus]|uniref:restriction endonuclease subunit S n=1 Tax=Vibrio caribbeanicus TaxID=701175 RepID=UPI0030DD86CE